VADPTDDADDATRSADDARLGAIARHALHDEELIAAFAADDLGEPFELERARALVERCATCRDLARDLAGIRTAVRASGAAVERAATLAAPRDFRLSAEDAARLRPELPLLRLGTRLGLRARIGLGIAAFGRPVGAAMATFGVVGLLIGSLTFGGGPGSLFLVGAGGAAPSEPGAEHDLPAPQTSTDRTAYGPQATAAGPQPTADDAKAARNGAQVRDRGGQAIATLALFGVSIALVVLGILLFRSARRRPATASEP
jgi:hypothetical protein